MLEYWEERWVDRERKSLLVINIRNIQRTTYLPRSEDVIYNPHLSSNEQNLTLKDLEDVIINNNR